MQLGFHFGFKKSKAYGLCGVMLTILFLGMSGHSAKANEMLSPADTSSSLRKKVQIIMHAKLFLK
ncbi:MAG: putative cross-wall-targeting lipoprotein signal domain-containing protein [Streptococcus salivarius]